MQFWSFKNLSTAKHLAYDGYKDVGYEYVNIDDCWMNRKRDAKDQLVPNPDLFPNGIKVTRFPPVGQP